MDFLRQLTGYSLLALLKELFAQLGFTTPAVKRADSRAEVEEKSAAAATSADANGPQDAPLGVGASDTPSTCVEQPVNGEDEGRELQWRWLRVLRQVDKVTLLVRQVRPARKSDFVGELKNVTLEVKSTAPGGPLEDGRVPAPRAEQTRAKNARLTSTQPPKGKSSAAAPLAVTPNDPYLVSVKYSISDVSEVRIERAILDPGSPVSLITASRVPPSLRLSAPLGNCALFGINNSRLEVLGTFERCVQVENVSVRLRFLVVPDRTIAHKILLGRDFTRNPALTIALGDRVMITKNEHIRSAPGGIKSATGQILVIDGVDGTESPEDKLNVNPKIEARMKAELVKIFKDGYLKGFEKEGVEDHFRVKITLMHDRPISHVPQKFSESDKEKLQVILEDWSDRGLIRPSESPYGTPLVLMHLGGEQVQLRPNFLGVNEITMPRDFVQEPIDEEKSIFCQDEREHEILERLRGKKYYSLLDPKDFYYPMKMEEDSIPITAFITPFGKYEWLYCPSGLIMADEALTRYLRLLFRDLLRRKKFLLIKNNIHVATDDAKTHLEILRQIFEIAGRYHLKFSLDECNFLYREMNYLDYRVTELGLCPSDANVEAIARYQTLRDFEEVLGFMRIASKFHRFIPKFWIDTEPFNQLVMHQSGFLGPSELATFRELRDCVISRPTVAIFSPRAKTELHCYTVGTTGYGAMLLQRQPDGKMRPTSYFSTRAPSNEKLSSFEMECSAVTNAVEHYRVELLRLNKKFKILTDCEYWLPTFSSRRMSDNPKVIEMVRSLGGLHCVFQQRNCPMACCVIA